MPNNNSTLPLNNSYTNPDPNHSDILLSPPTILLNQTEITSADRHSIPWRYRRERDNNETPIRTYQDLGKLYLDLIETMLTENTENDNNGYTHSLCNIWHFLSTPIQEILRYRDITSQSRIDCNALTDFLDKIDFCWVNITGSIYSTEDDEVSYCERCEEYNLDGDMRYFDPHDQSYCECCHGEVEEEYEEEHDQDYNFDSSLPYIHDYHYRGCETKRYDLTKKEDAPSIDMSIPGLHKFGIGFEIEKTSVNGLQSRRGNIVNQPLFSHWETDSSCGVEGITHVYNLADYEFFKHHVHRSDYLNEPTNSRCGGHTNVSFNSSDVTDFMFTIDKIPQHTGIIYALFKKRLLNDYCRYNKKIKADSHRSGRYCCVLDKGTRLEFRLPSKIKTEGQLLRRFKLFQIYCAHIYSYHQHKYDYNSAMHTINSRLDLQYGTRTLYRNLRHDDFFNTSFFGTDTYKRTRFLIHDLCKYLDVSYRNRPKALANTIIDAYLFQAWLDENDNACLLEDDFVAYLRDPHSNTNPLTLSQRAFFNDVPHTNRINNQTYYADNVPTNEHENVLNNT